MKSLFKHDQLGFSGAVRIRGIIKDAMVPLKVDARKQGLELTQMQVLSMQKDLMPMVTPFVKEKSIKSLVNKKVDEILKRFKELQQ